MSKLFKTLVRILGSINKYFLAFILFIVLTFFLGDSTLQKRYQYNHQINELEKKIEESKKLKDENTKKLEALRSDNESLETFAREQYQMTKPNEELFIIR